MTSHYSASLATVEFSRNLCVLLSDPVSFMLRSVWVRTAWSCVGRRSRAFTQLKTYQIVNVFTKQQNMCLPLVKAEGLALPLVVVGEVLEVLLQV